VICSVTSSGHLAAVLVVSITRAKSDNFHVIDDWPVQVNTMGEDG
jgi:hypothetical protein